MIFFHNKKKYRYLISLFITSVFFLLVFTFLNLDISTNNLITETQNFNSINISLSQEKLKTAKIESVIKQEKAISTKSSINTKSPINAKSPINDKSFITEKENYNSTLATSQKKNIETKLLPDNITTQESSLPTNQTTNSQALSLIAQRIQDNLVYPTNAKRRNIQGSVEIKISVNKIGILENFQIIKSSGKKILDEEAIKLLGKIFPLPKNTNGLPLEKNITINYKLSKD